VGIARRLYRGPVADKDLLRQRYLELLENSSFLSVAERATADEESVFKRLELATAAFADIN